ncbi:hypothetical protein [Salibacter sp.]|uniref:hypothetical protein n=1 Tax=Salibacter sp. TaxID=2010995 RepID=UPI0028701218|nr:hypothetical protein [Salibacter sp.]MDR9487824.1 hypothetical protein [Salibacter sp.]
MSSEAEQNIIIYNTNDGKASVALYAKGGNVWMNQQQLAELFDTSIPNISMHASNILKEKELDRKSVIKDYLTTDQQPYLNQTLGSETASIKRSIFFLLPVM